jgi:hypothetical protein
MILDDEEIDRGAYSDICTFCKHYQDNYSCQAFKKIPDAIWFGKNKHRKPYPNDNGIRFEPIKEPAKQ